MDHMQTWNRFNAALFEELGTPPDLVAAGWVVKAPGFKEANPFDSFHVFTSRFAWQLIAACVWGFHLGRDKGRIRTILAHEASMKTEKHREGLARRLRARWRDLVEELRRLEMPEPNTQKPDV